MASNGVLTKEMILQKTRNTKLDDVRNISFWGLKLTNIDIIRSLKNVESIALSANNISSLKVFQNCSKLRELFLRKNQISSLSEINYLQNLKNLRTLWLTDNPVTKESDYRMFVIATLPQITKLDEVDVTPDEQIQAKSKFSDLPRNTKKEHTKVDPTQVCILQSISHLLPALDEVSLNILSEKILEIKEEKQQNALLKQ